MPDDRLSDPFGETSVNATWRSDKVSASRVGVVLFWLVVVALVVGRAFYQS
jgi:hypothetical protein